MRNGLFRENQANDCQDIEELRRIYCEETDRARPARIDELSMHQERNLMIESIVDSISGFREQLCQMRWNFTIVKQRAALKRPTFPVSPLFRVPEP